jgi:hypothetical protein
MRSLVNFKFHWCSTYYPSLFSHLCTKHAKSISWHESTRCLIVRLLGMSEPGPQEPYRDVFFKDPDKSVYRFLSFSYRLPPTTVRMNHEQLPRHGLYLATSSMTSQGQIWQILNITSSFSATLFWPNFQ